MGSSLDALSKWLAGPFAGVVGETLCASECLKVVLPWLQP